MSDAALNPARLNPVRLNPTPVRTIAAKDIRDGLRDRFILIVTAFLGLAALVALVTGAIALRSDGFTTFLPWPPGSLRLLNALQRTSF